MSIVVVSIQLWRSRDTNLDNLTSFEKKSLGRFFSEEDLDTCDIAVTTMAYSENISGKLGTYGDVDHGPAGTYLDETASGFGNSIGATPLYNLRWYAGVEKTDPDYLNSRKIRGDTDSPNWTRRSDMKGYVVAGRNGCAKMFGLRDDRFILLLDHGRQARGL